MFMSCLQKRLYDMASIAIVHVWEYELHEAPLQSNHIESALSELKMLPMFRNLTDTEVDFVFQQLKKSFKNYK